MRGPSQFKPVLFKGQRFYLSGKTYLLEAIPPSPFPIRLPGSNSQGKYSLQLCSIKNIYEKLDSSIQHACVYQQHA